MRNLVLYLVMLRKEKNLFTIQEAAYHCKCSEMTIRNFEACNGKSNLTILCYYLAEIIFQCESDRNVIDNLLLLIKDCKEDLL